MYEPGSIIAGKYRVDHVLGEGGMGMVVAATHMGLGQRVALKFLHTELCTNADVVERFAREARASAQLRGEHVCRVSDVGNFDDGTPYMVMELLDGRDLATVLKANGPLPAGPVCDYVLQACLAIAEAHALGIVHRDLKPGNIFLTVRPDGTALVKVLDFGVAKAPSDGDFSLTQTSAVIGSPGYMSPEQLRSSKEADARSDIWSLGVTLFELIAGRQPFSASSITELTLRIAMDPLPPMPGGLPWGLAQVIERCMEKDPAARYPDVGALAAALAPFASANGHEIAGGVARVVRGSQPAFVPGTSGLGSAPTIHQPTHPSNPTTLRGASGQFTPVPAPRSNRKLAMGIGALVGLAAAIVVVVMTTGRGSNAPNAPSAPVAASPSASPSAPSASPSPSPTPSPTASPTPSPTPSPTAPTTPSATPTGTPTATPTGTPTATPTGTPTATPTGTPTATPTGTPTTPSPATPKKKPPHKTPAHPTTPEDINDSRM